MRRLPRDYGVYKGQRSARLSLGMALVLPSSLAPEQLIVQEYVKEGQHVESRPEDLQEDDARVHSLPGEEVGQPVLPRGAHEQVHRGQLQATVHEAGARERWRWTGARACEEGTMSGMALCMRQSAQLKEPIQGSLSNSRNPMQGSPGGKGDAGTNSENANGCASPRSHAHVPSPLPGIWEA